MEDKVYVVTLYKKEDLEEFYAEMQANNFRLANKRPISRNTHYWMSEDQAVALRQDPRVWDVQLVDSLKIKPFSYTNPESYVVTGNFWKDDTVGQATVSVNDFQWGHLHSAGNTTQRRKGTWGSGSTNETVSDSVTIFNDGKHVDVVICDNGVSYDCEEWYSPSSNATRFVQYQWFTELNSIVGSIDDDFQTLPTGSITYYQNSNNPEYHGTHVAGTLAGQHYGWAREANIYGFQILGSMPSGQSVPILLIFDYLRAFHRNKPINQTTGVKNPTITNHSWGGFWDPKTFSDITNIYYRGTNYSSSNPGPSGWTEAGIEADFGFQFNNDIPAYSAAVSADVQDAVEEGIVIISAAGNSNFLISNQGSSDWDNTASFSGGFGTIYYNRGSYPSSPDSYSILVGALGNTDNFTRATFSNYGPGIDVFAPGVDILSAYNSTGLPDSKYSQGSGNYFVPISGTSMASPQVAGIIACAATGKDRFTQYDALNYIQNNNYSGDMTFDVSPTYPSISRTFTIDGLNGTTDWVVSGSDLNGSFSQSNDPTITVYENDNITFSFPGGTSSYVTVDGANGTSDYLMTIYDDRVVSNGSSQANDPTINIEEGDFLTIELVVDLLSHPIHIRTNPTDPNTDVASPTVTGQGSTTAYSALTFEPQVGDAGTYYYVCNNHSSNMQGQIIVHPAGTYGLGESLYIKTSATTGIGDQVSGATNQGATSGSVSWTVPTGTAGNTYYYQSGNTAAISGQIVVASFPGVIGQAGNLADQTCQAGSPNLEIKSQNPRASEGFISEVKGIKPLGKFGNFLPSNQTFPRNNTLFK